MAGDGDFIDERMDAFERLIAGLDNEQPRNPYSPLFTDALEIMRDLKTRIDQQERHIADHVHDG